MAHVTDEPLDAYVNRPLAELVVKAVVNTPITPNQLTFASLLLGTLAGVCIAVGLPVAGALTLFASMVLDCSDGQLARARGGGSVLGRIIDGYADYWVALVVHVGILVQVFRAHLVVAGHGVGALESFVFVLAAGTSMGVHAGFFDYYKHRYLAHTGRGGPPEEPEMYLEEAERVRWSIVRAGLRLFAFYVRTQQGPAFHAAAAEARVTASDPIRVARFERENGLLVRLHGMTGPTMHNAAICVTCLVAPFVEHAFVWYCAFVLVAVNLYGLALHVVQRRVLARERARATIASWA